MVVQKWDIQGSKTQIKFYNLKIDGNTSYAFRLGGNEATVGTIESFEFVSCNISNLSSGGVICMRDAGASAAHIGNIVFDDCNIKDIGNYSLVHSEGSASTSQVDNISMSNTTASGFTRCIIRLDQSATVNVKIDHCTFYDSAKDITSTSSYWLRLSNSATPSVSVTNTLFGKCEMTTSQVVWPYSLKMYSIPMTAPELQEHGLPQPVPTRTDCSRIREAVTLL